MLEESKPILFRCVVCDNTPKRRRKSGAYKVLFNHNHIYFKCSMCKSRYRIDLEDCEKKIKLFK